MMQFNSLMWHKEQSLGITGPSTPEEDFPADEDSFRRTFEDAGIGMALLTLEGSFYSANRTLCRMFGYTEEELLEKTLQELAESDDVSAALDEAWSLLPGQRQGCQFEKRYRHRDGHMIWVCRTFSLIRDMNGGARHFFVCVEDVTERVRAEEALRLSEERFRRLAAQAPIGIFMVDPKGDVVYTNPKCEEITGLSQHERLGVGWKSALHPEDRESTMAAWAETIRTGADFYHEARFLKPEGEVCWAQSSMVPLRDWEGKIAGYVGTSVNISEIKHLQQKLVEQNAALEVEAARAREGNRLKSEFLTNMSHELRTPLNAIIGFSELLRDQKPGPLNPRQVDFLDDVLHGAKHLLGLINDLLDLAKVEAGRMELVPESFLLRDAISEVATCLHPLIEAKGLAYSVSIDLEDDQVVLDHQKIKQVLYNLLSNAIKFTPDGGSIVLGLAPHGGEIELTVCDTGVGIPPGDLERLFGEFQQLQPRHNGVQQGTGLGLALARKFVILHGGTIRVESEAGQGTTFIVVLPREIESEKKS